MIYDRQIIDALEKLRPAPWKGIVFRHMFGNFPPERENVRGARWNPPETPAIYASLNRETAIAEADYYVNLQPLRPRAVRKIYRIQISLNSVLDLSDWSNLDLLGLEKDSFASDDHINCQLVGGAVEWLRHDGMLVPSARASGTNLVVFPNRQKSDYEFKPLDFEQLEDQR